MNYFFNYTNKIEKNVILDQFWYFRKKNKSDTHCTAKFGKTSRTNNEYKYNKDSKRI